MIWFTADLHLDHDKIRTYCKRPFISTKEMNAAIIDNWNAVVKPGDQIYILGDFAWGEWPSIVEHIKKLQGNKFFIRGNHDRNLPLALGQGGFRQDIPLRDVHEVKDECPQHIWLSHYPHESWPASHHGSYHLHGHCHGELREQDMYRRIDVGVDCNGFAPVSLTKVIERMEAKKWSVHYARDL